MKTYKQKCEELNATEEYIVDLIVDLNSSTKHPISTDHIRSIAEKCAPSVIEDLYDTADHEDWNCDDVALAFGRALMNSLGIEH